LERANFRKPPHTQRGEILENMKSRNKKKDLFNHKKRKKGKKRELGWKQGGSRDSKKKKKGGGVAADRNKVKGYAERKSGETGRMPTSDVSVVGATPSQCGQCQSNKGGSSTKVV